MSKRHRVLVGNKNRPISDKSELPIKTIFFDYQPYERTEVIEEWFDTEKEVIDMNGTYEKLTVVCSETTTKILDSITDDDFIKWKVKRGYTTSFLDKPYPEFINADE